ncbi:MAG: ATP-dependent RNA helicase DeaD [Anaerolineaceae bacterium]|nr:MAG: ATP-dependent RNA helicase DeaD [Anaerolineaceae bacterium]
MTTQFTDLNLRPELVQAVTALGYTEPTPIQAALIPVMLTGADVIGQAQTGTGKTAAFALPILHNLEPGQRHVQALVLCPTRELALQVAGAITEYGSVQNVRVLAVYGGQPYGPQISKLNRGVDVVVGTPGRLMDLMDRNSLNISHVKTVVLDEADEMLSMGFVEDIETILAETPADRQTALFSATLPNPIRRLADKYMHAPQSIQVQRAQVTLEAIEQRYYLVNQADKLAALTRLFEVEPITSALIFVRTRAGTGELSGELTRRGFPAESLNGDLTQEARERTLNRFRQNQVKVLVATDVAARGLDIDDISHVFNYDLPDDPEIYIHRIGRTGRAGKTGIAISMVTPREKRLLRQIESLIRQPLAKSALPTEEDIKIRRENELLENVKVWLVRARYRRERELVARLVEEGHDPLEIAAAALKLARADEKQRPVAAVSEVQDAGPRRYPQKAGAGERDGKRQRFSSRERGSFPREAAGSVSHESGMVRISMSMGRAHGIRPNDVVGAIAYHADIPGSTIGKIFIEDQRTLVDVPEHLVNQVLSKAGKYSLRRQPFTVERV